MRLVQTSFDKKTYLSYLKVSICHFLLLFLFLKQLSQGYMKAVEAKLAESNPDRVDAFKTGAQAYAKKIVGNFKDYEFVRSL